MKKPENIYVSLQLNKDVTSGELLLNIQFDRDAPNFFADKNNVSWSPTIQELDFISEAFGLIARGKHHRSERGNDLAEKETPTIRDADEKAILDRVLEKKDRVYNSR